MSKKLDDKGQFFLSEFGNIQSSQKDDREECRADRRFATVTGAPWEGDYETFFEKKPKIELNLTHHGVLRVFNEYRNNRLEVKFRDKGGQDDDLAELAQDKYRADVDECDAQEAFDAAFDEAVLGGIGAFALTTEYEDEFDPENDYQKISFEPIYDADISVYWSLDGKRQDKRDCKRCYRVFSMTKDDFEEAYPNHKVSDWPRFTDGGGAKFDWYRPDMHMVFLAYVYEIEDETYTLHIFEEVAGNELRIPEDDLTPEKLYEFEVRGTTKVRERKVKRQRVHKYLMSGGGVVEDMGLIAGSHIPIVMVYGKRWYIDSKERTMGHVRLGKDAQRLLNVLASRLAEGAAATPVSDVPIVAPQQIAGLADHWSKANKENIPYRVLKPLRDQNGQVESLGPTGALASHDAPPVVEKLLGFSENFLKKLMGNLDKAEDVVSGVSGTTVELIQTRLDMQTFIYVDNMRKAMKRSGEIWLGMASEIYVEEGRNLTVMGRDGNVAAREIGEPILMEDGRTAISNDLSRANFGVSVDVGPATESKRAAMVRNMLAMGQIVQSPESQEILEAQIWMNSEGEGMSDIREYYRKKLVQMGVMKPTKQDQKDMAAAAEQEKEPNEMERLAAATAAKEAAQAQKLQADTALSMAKTEETQAKTAETLAGIPREDQKAAIDGASKIRQSVN